MECTDIAVIIPSLNPDEKLCRVVDSLIKVNFSKIIIVNDGSDESHSALFDRFAALPSCTVLTHEINRGKGAALKTAFSYVSENLPSCPGVITVDGDGQHEAGDILACCREMLAQGNKVILGARDFSLKSVPARSKLGNTFTSFIFKVCCGISVSDTQTGLRAIPFRYLSFLSAIEGERFEYETNMLLEMKNSSVPFAEVAIKTVYIDENASSHFHPIRDSLRIYKLIFKFISSSLVSFLVDALVFFLCGILFPYELPYRILIQTVIARALSSVFNFTINKRLVFSSKAGVRKTLLKYYALCIPQMLISAGLVVLLADILKITSPYVETPIKILVDLILFLISFRIQREWVFKKQSDK